MKIEVVALQKSAKKFEKPIEYLSKALFRILKSEKSQVSIYLVGNASFEKFKSDIKNKKIQGVLHRDGFNVLSFPSKDDFPRPYSQYESLGEIYLHPDYIKRHEEDIVFMLVHGLLHLMGFDHKKRYDRMEMEREEQRLIRALKKKRIRGIKELTSL